MFNWYNQAGFDLVISFTGYGIRSYVDHLLVAADFFRRIILWLRWNGLHNERGGF